MAERIIGQTSVRAEGFETRTVSGPKRYRCPHCEGWIEPFVRHVVAFLLGEPEDRRHYHRGCWIKRTAALKKKTK